MQAAVGVLSVLMHRKKKAKPWTEVQVQGQVWAFIDNVSPTHTLLPQRCALGSVNMWAFVCVCVCVCVRVHSKYFHEMGWTVKINKYERVEQLLGKSLAHWGLPHIVFACLGSNGFTRWNCTERRRGRGAAQSPGSSNNQPSWRQEPNSHERADSYGTDIKPETFVPACNFWCG